MASAFYARCAETAAQTLTAYAEATCSLPIDEHTVADLICDLGHYCERHGFPFIEVAQRAIGHWSAELDDPHGMAAAPHVSITISLRTL